MNKKELKTSNCTIALDNEIFYALPKELVDFVKNQEEEIERLNNIIDKAREYIEMIVKSTPSSIRKNYANMLLIDYKKLLEILDKGENKQ